MIPLTLGVAILDGHTRLACLETDAPIIAALGAADVDLVHHLLDTICIEEGSNLDWREITITFVE
jgi:hypothetical protein